MTDHDRLCPGRAGIADVWPSACQCELVAEVRADERERIKQPLAEALAKTKADLEYVLSAEEVIRADERADLRAKVEALSPWRVLQGGGAEWLNRAEVLALIDGSSHGPS